MTWAKPFTMPLVAPVRAKTLKHAKGLLPFLSSTRHNFTVRSSTHCKSNSKLAQMYPTNLYGLLINTPEVHTETWETSHLIQWPFANCVSVTPALMIPVDDCPPVTTVPASSTSSEPLHFWCVKVSTPCLRSSRWMSCT